MGAGLAELSGRLRERRPELEEAVLARARDVADPGEVEDPEYANGLHTAVSAGVGYGLAAIDATGELPAELPEALELQARLAARNGVSLDTVLRRYLAGHTLLSDCLIEEVEDSGLTEELKGILRREAVLFDRLVASISKAHACETHGRLRSPEQRRTERVRRLLGGELVDPVELGYQLEGWHIGAVATGPGAAAALRELAGTLDRRLLSIRADECTLWAWLGGRRRVSSRDARRLVESFWPANARLALGEPAHGLAGWRLTHRQAKAAIAVALRGEQGVVRYSDVALLSLAISDDTFVGSLRNLYLTPLECEPDGGITLKNTLREYFAAGCNVSSAAAALGIRRQTVSARLRTVEEKLECPVDGSSAELKLALNLSELEALPRTLR